jgi:hypothetical protein
MNGCAWVPERGSTAALSPSRASDGRGNASGSTARSRLASGGSDERIEVDYALGGGSSGARLSDGGASSSSGTGAIAAGATYVVVTNATVIAAGEQGAIAWQPFGAQGKRHGDGDWSCGAVCAGVDAE